MGHGDSKGEKRVRSRHQNNIRRAKINVEERNVGTKGKISKTKVLSIIILSN